MKKISKKKLQKIANWIGVEIRQYPSKILYFVYGAEDWVTCPELGEEEIIKPQEKWSYPIADHVPECGFFWALTKGWDTGAWVKTNTLLNNYLLVLPDPNNPDKRPKKNWRPNDFVGHNKEDYEEDYHNNKCPQCGTISNDLVYDDDGKGNSGKAYHCKKCDYYF